jgi:hypothetical protein
MDNLCNYIFERRVFQAYGTNDVKYTSLNSKITLLLRLVRVLVVATVVVRNRDSDRFGGFEIIDTGNVEVHKFAADLRKVFRMVNVDTALLAEELMSVGVVHDVIGHDIRCSSG